MTQMIETSESTYLLTCTTSDAWISLVVAESPTKMSPKGCVLCKEGAVVMLDANDV